MLWHASPPGVAIKNLSKEENFKLLQGLYCSQQWVRSAEKLRGEVTEVTVDLSEQGEGILDTSYIVVMPCALAAPTGAQ